MRNEEGDSPVCETKPISGEAGDRSLHAGGKLRGRLCETKPIRRANVPVRPPVCGDARPPIGSGAGSTKETPCRCAGGFETRPYERAGRAKQSQLRECGVRNEEGAPPACETKPMGRQAGGCRLEASGSHGAVVPNKANSVRSVPVRASVGAGPRACPSLQGNHRGLPLRTGDDCAKQSQFTWTGISRNPI